MTMNGHGFSFFSLIGFFLFKLIYFCLNLFISAWVFIAVHGLSLAAASGSYSSLRWAGFSSRWLLLPQSTGSGPRVSVAVALWLSCCKACGIFPDQGSNSCLLHWQADSYPLYHQEVPKLHS